MSSIRVKTKYLEEGPYGSLIEHILYVNHNNSGDFVTVHDDSGNLIFSFPDTVKNNLYDAIVRAAGAINHSELPEGVEYMNDDDCKKCGLVK